MPNIKNFFKKFKDTRLGSILGGRKVVYLLIIILSLIASFVVIFLALKSAGEKQEQKLQQFSQETIVLKPTKELEAIFIQKGEEKIFDYKFSLQNLSEHDYEVSLQGGLTNETIRAPEAQVIEIAAGESKEFTLKVPLSFPKEEEAAQIDKQVHFVISTSVKVSRFIPEAESGFEMDFPLTLNYSSDNEIVGIEFSFSPEKITYNSTGDQPLSIKSKITNKVQKPIEEVVLEVDLIGLEGNRVQPLFVEGFALQAGQVLDKEKSFAFDLPPADHLKTGQKDYKLKLKLQGKVGDRNILLERVSEGIIKLDIVSI